MMCIELLYSELTLYTGKIYLYILYIYIYIHLVIINLTFKFKKHLFCKNLKYCCTDVEHTICMLNNYYSLTLQSNL